MSYVNNFFLSVFIVSFFALTCAQSVAYSIERISSDGMFRVKIESVSKEKSASRAYPERIRFQFFKNGQVVHTFESENSDPYAPSFKDANPSIDWVENVVLHVGESNVDQPFYDELLLSNETGEKLKYVNVSYGKYESFWVFDLASKKQIILKASPGFRPNGTSNYFVGYGGVTESGSKIEGTLEVKQRKSQVDGALKFRVPLKAR